VDIPTAESYRGTRRLVEFLIMGDVNLLVAVALALVLVTVVAKVFS
jgi:hypothetical protein